MKKYTKRLLSFLLASVMVLSGLPMNAKEVKAADTSFTLDFTAGTQGAYNPNTKTVGAIVTQGPEFLLTDTYAGAGWSLDAANTNLPETSLTEYIVVDGMKVYEACGYNSTYSVSIDGTTHTLGYKKGASVRRQFSNGVNTSRLYINYGQTIAFNFDAPETGEYNVDVTFVTVSNPTGMNVTINGNTQTVPAMTANATAQSVCTFENTVTLTAGSGNKISFTELAGKSAESNIQSVTFTKVSTGEPEPTEEPVATAEPTEEPVATPEPTPEPTAEPTPEPTPIVLPDTTLTLDLTRATEGAYNTSTSKVGATVMQGGQFQLTSNYAGNGWRLDPDNTNVAESSTIVIEGCKVYEIGGYNSTSNKAYGASVRLQTIDGVDVSRVYLNGGQQLAFKFDVEVSGDYYVIVSVYDNSTPGAMDVTVNGVTQNIDSGASTGAMIDYVLVTPVTLVAGSDNSLLIKEVRTTYNETNVQSVSFAKIPTITWVDADGTVLEVDDLVAPGTVPTYDGTTPTKAEDVAGTYEFAGWSPAVSEAMCDVTYTATYNVIPKEYAITWLNEDGSVLGTDSVAYGKVPEYTGATPTKSGDVQYSYTFANWSPEVVAVTGDATYTAEFDKVLNKYTVTFIANGEVVSEEEYDYGTMPVVPSVADYRDEANVYTFANWDKEIVAVEGEATYTAVYAPTAFEAKIDGVGYTTLAKAVEATEAGDEIVLAKDVTVAEKLVIESDDVITLNLGGKTLTLAVGDDSNYDIVVKGDLTIEGEGNVVVESTYGIGVTGNLTVNGGTYATSETNYYVIGSWGTVTINAGDFDVAYMAANGFAGSVAITGGTYKSADDDYVVAGDVTITGGTFDRDVTEYCAEGLATYETAEGVYTLARTYAEAIVANDRTFGEVAADGKTVTVKVTGEVEYAGSVVSQGVWNNWVGFAVEVPAGVDANVAKVHSVASGSVWTLAECLDTETTANFYWGIATADSTTRTYQIDWNGDGEYELDVVIDVADATLLTKTFNITWVVNGEPSTVAVTAGTMPEVPVVEDYATEDKNYTFAGWDADIAVAEADATYTAVFTATTRTYTVTWLNHDGTEIAVDVAEYGTTPEAPVASYKEYTFTGWDKEIAAVEGNVTYTAIYDIDGIDEGYYYVDGKVKGNAGVIQIGENLYFVCYSGKIAAGQNMTVPANKTNGLVDAGTYYFYEDGTMKNPADDFNGEIVDVDGTLWYYVKGEVRGNVGLVKVGDYYYYVHYSGKVVKDGNQTVSAAKANTDKTGIEAGTYYFFEDGVMLTNELKTTGGVVGEDGYYYVRGKLTKNVGLVKLGEDFYYVHYSGKVVQNGYQTVTEAKANGYTEYVGVRKFVDGVMVK